MVNGLGVLTRRIGPTELSAISGRSLGLVLCDHTRQLITHLDAIYALRLLEHLRTETGWKQTGLVVGTPATRLVIGRPDLRPEPSLLDKMSLDPDQCSHLLDVLTDNGRTLECLKEQGAEDLRRRLSVIYQRLLDFEDRGQASRSDGVLDSDSLSPHEQ